MSEAPELRALDPEDDHLTREVFIDAAKVSALTDDDGHGCFATDIQVSDVRVSPVEVLAPSFEWPWWASHVVWYNK